MEEIAGINKRFRAKLAWDCTENMNERELGDSRG